MNPVSEPTRLYRFVERRWMDAFFSDGSLRLNTTYDLRDTLLYSGDRGDGQEGQVRRVRVVDDLLLTGARPEPVVDRAVQVADGGAARITGCVFHETVTAPDRFVFSMSDGFSPELLRHFRDDVGADACYEITDTQFFSEISEVARGWATWFGCFGVTYIGDVVLYPSPEIDIAPDVLKRRRFVWQREVRSMWNGEAKPLVPQNIMVPEARRHARPFARIAGDRIEMLR